MIYCLSGKIIKKTLDSVVISCGGVGYCAQCPSNVAAAMPGAGSEATLYTVLNVTENDISLYGFATEEQQNCFKMLTGVSGVGPKLAQRIVLELKDKVAKGAAGSATMEDLSGVASTASGQSGSQAIAALVSLGYSQSEAALAISKIDPALPVEEIIRLALRGMAGGR